MSARLVVGPKEFFNFWRTLSERVTKRLHVGVDVAKAFGFRHLDVHAVWRLSFSRSGS
jgi:hypothetical protein